jgi:hypothetical protein
VVPHGSQRGVLRRAPSEDPGCRAGGRPRALSGAAYLTLALDDDAAAGERRLDEYLESYYNAPAKTIRARQATYAGPVDGCVAWIQRWIDAGARHLALRFAGGDHLAQVDEVAKKILPRLNRK